MSYYNDSVTFQINGITHTVSSDKVPLDTSLNTYIREYAHLTGTKFMCKEGGCGSCVVVLTTNNPFTRKSNTYAVNSCLLKIWSCQGCKITTIEGAKDFRYKNTGDGIADHLASNNGSQCGYCSPGMVMNMYGLIKGNQNINANDVENGFAGSICRCTGYKPILEAFRSFIHVSSNNSDSYSPDIEDTSCAVSCPLRRRHISSGEGDDSLESSLLEFALASPCLAIKFKDNQSWYKVSTVNEIFEIFDMKNSSNYMLINGDTAQGVSPEIFRDKPPTVYIDVSGVSELKSTRTNSSGLVLGGNVSITDFISFLNNNKSHRQFNYADELVEHLQLVANVPVRNTGTIAGNLMIKYNMLHKMKNKMMFQSDIFLLLETVGAKITIREKSDIMNDYLPSEFINLPSMDYKVITKITLPPLDSNKFKIRTYKIMPRAQNAPASVNAGFLFKLNKNIVESATIVYGGLNAEFVHAEKTESYLSKQDISDEKILTTALEKLKDDIPPHIILDQPPLMPVEYRQQLAFNLYYKTVLFLNSTKVIPYYKMGADKLHKSRGLSKGIESYETGKSEGVKGKRIPKLEAHLQCRGEAEYAYDIPVIFGQLYGALVVAPSGPGKLGPIDKSSTLKLPGVVEFLTASDIPSTGNNNMIELLTFVTPEYEELFCADKVLYAGQPVGIVVANTLEFAIKAARVASKKIKVTISDQPLMVIDEVLLKYKTIPNERVIITVPIPPVNASLHDDKNEMPDKIKEGGIKADEFTIHGEFNLNSQYHYTMELQTCVVVPIENGQFDVYSSTQWPFIVQRCVAHVLGTMENKVNVIVRRVGGAYGSKVTRPIYTACACALAAYKLQRPVRMVLDLETNMKSMGKRCPAKCRYNITVNEKTGEIIQFNQLDIFEDKGITLNDPVNYFIFGGFVNCYNIVSKLIKNGKLNLNMYAVKTDTASSSWCRAPGSLEGVFFIESIMNKIAFDNVIMSKGLTPVDVRQNNMDKTKPIYQFFEEKLKDMDYSNNMKKVVEFNKNNRWRKQGYAVIPIEFSIDYYLQFFSTVSINGGDGSISISHGACEIGQGINTKAAVAVAFVFGLPDLSNIEVKPTNVIYSPNNSVTGGSMASDAITFSSLRAAKAIKNRLDDLKRTLKLENISWADLISTAYAHNVNLNATYMWTREDATPPDPDFNKLEHYDVPAVCSTKVEVDILTGEHIVRSVVIYEQVGKSFAPMVDMGQVQGAFIMGLGYFTSEEILYDDKTGVLLTNRTWNYDPPGAKDIPESFDVHIVDKISTTGKEEGVIGAKATGEPPLCLSVSVFFAIKEALRSARENAGIMVDFDLTQPATIAVKEIESKTNVSQFKIISKK